jgi:hypothetical protein
MVYEVRENHEFNTLVPLSSPGRARHPAYTLCEGTTRAKWPAARAQSPSVCRGNASKRASRRQDEGHKLLLGGEICESKLLPLVICG